MKFRSLIFELRRLQTFEVCLCISLVLTLVVARRQHSLGWISTCSPIWSGIVLCYSWFLDHFMRAIFIWKKKNVTEGERDYSELHILATFFFFFFYLSTLIFLFLYLHTIFLKLWLCKPHSLVWGGIYNLFVQLSRAHLATYMIDLENVVASVCGTDCKLSSQSRRKAGSWWEDAPLSVIALFTQTYLILE